MESDPQSASIITQLLILLILTLINAFFSGSEMAVVSVNKNKIHRLAEQGNKNAALIERLMEDSTVFLSTIQVAITLAGFFSSASAATGIAQVLAVKMSQWNVPYSQTAAGVLVTILLAYFNLVFGELVPKRIALQKAEGFSLFCVGPVYFISRIMNPFIHLLTFSTSGILKLMGMHSETLETDVSEEEIKSLLETGSETGVFNEIEKEMITSIPVYEGDLDNIIGILSTKLLVIQARERSFETLDIRSILLPPYFVPENLRTDALFEQMQARKEKMAILVDEYGGVSGMVTLEDLIEEIVGDIHEKYEEEEPEIQELEPHRVYRIAGSISLFDLKEKLHLHMDSTCDTLSGYLMELLGHIPEEGELPLTAQTEEAYFEIESVEDRVIDKVKLTLRDLPDAIEGEEMLQKISRQM